MSKQRAAYGRRMQAIPLNDLSSVSDEIDRLNDAIVEADKRHRIATDCGAVAAARIALVDMATASDAFRVYTAKNRYSQLVTG
jgi:hypothetical protein